MLLRNQIDKKNLYEINIKIEAYQKMTNFYETYLENNNYPYVQQRLNYLYNILAEYFIAKDDIEKQKII